METNNFELAGNNGKQHYVPPKQGAAGQIFDSIFLLILIYCVLLMPLVLGLTAGNTVTNIPETITWETLGQNEVMQGQWERLGKTPEEAAEYIGTRYVYDINPVSLIFTAIIIVGYFLIVLRFSDKEYKEVISEKFD
jgi:hypothetical protein